MMWTVCPCDIDQLGRVEINLVSITVDNHHDSKKSMIETLLGHIMEFDAMYFEADIPTDLSWNPHT